jgi:hypothetical protein
MQRPTGQPGAIHDRIFCCIVIECPIQDVANTAILGMDLAESSHSCNNGNSILSDVIADGAGANSGPDGDSRGSSPVADIHFNFYGGNQEGNKMNKEVVAATSTDVNAVVAEVNGDNAARALPCLQLL